MITCQGWEKHVRRSEVIRSTVRLNPPSGGSTTLQARAPPNLPHHPIFSEKSEPIFFLLSHVLFRVSQPQPSAIDIGLQSCSPHLSRSAKRANRFTYVILVSVRSELFVKMHLINRYLRSVMSQFHSQGPIQDSDWETHGGGGRSEGLFRSVSHRIRHALRPYAVPVASYADLSPDCARATTHDASAVTQLSADRTDLCTPGSVP